MDRDHGRFLDGDAMSGLPSWPRAALLRLAASGVLAAGLVACRFGGSELYSDEGEHSGDAGANDAAADGSNADAQGGSIPDLAGNWAQLWTVASVDSLPVIGDVSASTTTIHRLWIEQHGLDLLVHVETCRIEIDSGTDIIQEIIPDAFVASLGTAVRTAWLEKAGSRYRYIQPRTYEIRGVRLVDAANDVLPQSPEDPRVYDQDQDGLPGMTVRVTGLVDGEVWVAQRDWHEVDGVVTGADLVEGTIHWAKEQVVLGADNPLLTSPLPSVPDPDASRSRARMVRLAEDLDCKEILDRTSSLFGPPGRGR